MKASYVIYLQNKAQSSSLLPSDVLACIRQESKRRQTNTRDKESPQSNGKKPFFTDT